MTKAFASFDICSLKIENLGPLRYAEAILRHVFTCSSQGEIDMRIINDLSAVIHAFMPIGSTNAVKLVEFLCKGQCHAVFSNSVGHKLVLKWIESTK